jgi:hypothetical protein
MRVSGHHGQQDGNGWRRARVRMSVVAAEDGPSVELATAGVRNLVQKILHTNRRHHSQPQKT